MNNASAPAGYTPITPPSRGYSSGSSDLLKTVSIIILGLLLVGSCVLSYYFFTEYTIIKTDVDGQIDTAVVKAEKTLTDQLEEEFSEREKYPYKTFTGPADYGSLNFEYPKTWSVFINRDASSGGNFEAYLHPDAVPPLSNETINALRVTISSENYDSVANRYLSAVNNGELSSSILTINDRPESGFSPISATRYDGKINNTFVGSILIFKVRDKTIILQSDAEAYRADFDKIINTITVRN